MQYQVTFEIYRDCSSFGALFDDPINYSVFHANGTLFASFTQVLPIPDTIPIVYDDPCVTPPNDVCIERAIYIDTIALPPSIAGFYVTYQRCCWATNILNIDTPSDWGITITTAIPGSALISDLENNCARFSEYPPIVLCSNNTLVFDHSAFDLDGDSLVYSVCAPKTFNISAGVEPNPEPPAPYLDVPYESDFSSSEPFGTSANVSINSSTGVMTITPDLVGVFVMAVCVEEWRDGVLINIKSRTFGYRVVQCNEILPIEVDVIGAFTLIEDCRATGFVVTREDTTNDVHLQVLLSGEAINGVDYEFLSDTVTLVAGVASDTIAIFPFLDTLVEGQEDLIFSIVVSNPCDSSFDTTTVFITIEDYIPMTLSHTDSVNVCSEKDMYAFLECFVEFGVAPYYYSWYPNYSLESTMNFPTDDLHPNLNLFSVEVFDVCGKKIISDPIRVYEQCPLQAPNVITSNNDNINEFFIVKNLEDYDRVHLIIFNRWGNIVYESTAYKNDWKGNDRNGNPLNEGTYTYLVTPESEKFIYDDADRSKYTAHGFVQIIRD